MAKKKKKSKNPKTKAPTGLSIKRSNMDFICEWKAGDSNYKKGQLFWYKTNLMKNWKSIKVGPTTRRVTVSLSSSSYWPNKSKELTYVAFRVQGKKDSYSKGSGKHKITYYPKWSSKSHKKMTINYPASPTSASFSLSNEVSNSGTFSYESMQNTDDSRPFVSCYWQSVLIKECSTTNGKKVSWKNYISGTGNATGSKTITEDSSVLAKGSYTRWFRVLARGARGNSDWRYARHVYAIPHRADVIRAGTIKTYGGRTIKLEWKSRNTVARPIDTIAAQYTMATPKADIICPEEASWEALTTTYPKDDTDGATVEISKSLPKDQCIWVRVNTKHDNNEAFGKPFLAEIGELKEPAIKTVEIDVETKKATITAINNSEIPDAYLIIFFRTEKEEYTLGVISPGSDSAIVQCPGFDGNYTFGIQAVQGQPKTISDDNGVTKYVSSSSMKSQKVWKEGDIPIAPSNIILSQHSKDTISVSWNNTWKTATSATISWAQNPDAWESTKEPQTYDISSVHASRWLISGLEPGVWYVRVRLNMGKKEELLSSPWSKLAEIDISASPHRPALTLSNTVVSKEGEITATWSYVSGDGTKQAYAEIREAIITSEGISYGDIIASAHSGQSASFKIPKAWQEETTHYIACKTISISGKASAGWSEPIGITVAKPLNAVIEADSLKEMTIEDEEGNTRNIIALKSMPLTVKVTGAGGGLTTIAIERAEDYHMLRPDWHTHEGYKGETVALKKQQGEEEITIDIDDLIGVIDDGAKYSLVATVSDSLGQTAEVRKNFETHWEHQALMPGVQAQVDMDKLAVKITPTATEGMAEDDTVDIYRLSADEPELIITEGKFGQTYVDPYPAFGYDCGHRIVTKTKNGDYITAEGSPAWMDVDEDDGDYLDVDFIIINFDGHKVKLPYNIILDNSWAKDFERISYLGGSVIGDWNPAVTRDLSVKTVAIATKDSETIQSMRMLSTYPGICHIRTPEGSSFEADIQVTEGQSYDKGIVEYSLKVQRVEPEDLEGMTLEEWEALNEL